MAEERKATGEPEGDQGYTVIWREEYQIGEVLEEWRAANLITTLNRGNGVRKRWISFRLKMRHKLQEYLDFLNKKKNNK